jgi:2-iminobutanoate/2-iminopropanoate deaminase
MNIAFGPYSSYQIAGNLVFTAGQVGVTDGVAPLDIGAQTKLALENLENVLSDAGASLRTVVKTTVYLTDMAHFAEMNIIYAKIFDNAGCRPARSTIAVKELPRVADNVLLVELEAVAFKELA